MQHINLQAPNTINPPLPHTPSKSQTTQRIQNLWLAKNLKFKKLEKKIIKDAAYMENNKKMTLFTFHRDV